MSNNWILCISVTKFRDLGRSSPINFAAWAKVNYSTVLLFSTVANVRLTLARTLATHVLTKPYFATETTRLNCIYGLDLQEVSLIFLAKTPNRVEFLFWFDTWWIPRLSNGPRSGTLSMHLLSQSMSSLWTWFRKLLPCYHGLLIFTHSTLIQDHQALFVRCNFNCSGL
jgi:hypothetical protein